MRWIINDLPEHAEHTRRRHAKAGPRVVIGPPAQPDGASVPMTDRELHELGLVGIWALEEGEEPPRLSRRRTKKEVRTMMRILQHDWSNEKLADTWPEDLGPADLVIADPPYNIGVDYADDESGDKVDDIVYRCWVAGIIDELSRYSRDGAVLAWICPWDHGHWIFETIQAHWGPLLYQVVWHEAFSQYQANALTNDYRFVFMAAKSATGTMPEGVVFNGDKIRVKSKRQQMGDKRANPKGRIPGTVWDIGRMPGNAKARVKWHPAQLPPKLLQRLIRGWSNPGDLVVDAFAGSGSAAVVADAEKRSFVGLDKSPTYVRLIEERISS